MEKAIAWLDVEANGRTPEVDSLLEVGMVVTDFQGEELSRPYTSLVKVSDLRSAMASADPLVQRMHNHSGLWRDLWEHESKEAEEIDAELCHILGQFDQGLLFFFGGNSITLDRGFAGINLPRFSTTVSHMSIDATTLASVLQETMKAPRFHKRRHHRALPDVYESIDEYKFYLRFLAEREAS
jgi:oligoribonuclease